MPARTHGTLDGRFRPSTVLGSTQQPASLHDHAAPLHPDCAHLPRVGSLRGSAPGPEGRLVTQRAAGQDTQSGGQLFGSERGGHHGLDAEGCQQPGQEPGVDQRLADGLFIGQVNQVELVGPT